MVHTSMAPSEQVVATRSPDGEAAQCRNSTPGIGGMAATSASAEAVWHQTLTEPSDEEDVTISAPDLPIAT